MTDREMLELAAKAGGVALSWDADGIAWLGNFPSCKRWNPLTSSKDAFELAARLTIDISHNHPAEQQRYVAADSRGCEGVFGPVCCMEDEFDECNRVAATRRAITRAAAAIQEAKEMAA